MLSEGLRILARATRTVFARVYQRREDEARVKRDVCAAFGLLVRHYSGCRADAAAAAGGWREGLIEQRAHLRGRLAALGAARESDAKSFVRRRRNAVAARKAETRLARVEKELLGAPRHCFGGRKLLRQGRISAWRARRDGNALFAGETGKLGGNEVARWDLETGRLVVKLPCGLPPVALYAHKWSGNLFTTQAESDPSTAYVEPLTELSGTHWKIVAVCDVPRSLTEIMNALGVAGRGYFKRRHLDPLLRGGVLRMTHLEQPRHPGQAYVLTEAGVALKSRRVKEDAGTSNGGRTNGPQQAG